jgi:hypothetical protein
LFLSIADVKADHTEVEEMENHFENQMPDEEEMETLLLPAAKRRKLGDSDDGGDDHDYEPDEVEKQQDILDTQQARNIQETLAVAREMLPIRAEIRPNNREFILITGFVEEVTKMKRGGTSYFTPEFLVDGVAMSAEDLRNHLKVSRNIPSRPLSFFGSIYICGEILGRAGSWHYYRDVFPQKIRSGLVALKSGIFKPKIGADVTPQQIAWWDTCQTKSELPQSTPTESGSKMNIPSAAVEEPNMIVQNLEHNALMIKKSLPTVIRGSRPEGPNYGILVDVAVDYKKGQLKFEIFWNGKMYRSFKDVHKQWFGAMALFCAHMNGQSTTKHKWISLSVGLPLQVRRGNEAMSQEGSFGVDPQLPQKTLDQLAKFAGGKKKEKEEVESKVKGPEKKLTDPPQNPIVRRKFEAPVSGTALSSRLQTFVYRRGSESTHSHSRSNVEDSASHDDVSVSHESNSASSSIFESSISSYLSECDCETSDLTMAALESIRLRNESVKKDFSSFTELDEHVYSGTYLGKLLAPMCCPTHTTARRKIVLPASVLWELWPITGALLNLRTIAENILRARDDFAEFWLYHSAVAVKRRELDDAALLRQIAFVAVETESSRSMKTKTVALKKLLRAKGEVNAVKMVERITEEEKDWRRNLLFACSECQSRFSEPGICATCGEATKFVPELI